MRNSKINLNKSILCIAVLLALLMIFASAGGLFASKFLYSRNEIILAYADEDNEYGFAGGDGSAESPFLIATPEHLVNINVNPQNFLYYEYPDPDYGGFSYRKGYYFKLTADIDLTDYLSEGAGYNDGKGWDPIGGNARSAFFGHFDGGGHTVSGLWVNRPEASDAGLFGYISDTDIKNLNIVLDAEKGITGGENTGGLVGYADSLPAITAVIEKCSVKGDIRVNGDITVTSGYYPHNYVGGLGGRISYYTVSQCAFEGRITYEAAAGEVDEVGIGGITGEVYEVNLKNCLVNAEFVYEAEFSVCTAGLFGLYSSRNTAEKCYVKLSGASLPNPFYGKVPKHMSGVKIPTDTCFVSGGDESVIESWDFENVWGFDKGGNIVLRAFGQAYDPPVPPDLTWLYITLPCLLFAAVVITTAIMLYRRKKTETVIVKETITQTETVVMEVPTLRSPLPKDLSKQEKRVAHYILQGMTRHQIADEMNVSDGSVKTYMSRIYVKSGVENQKEFIARYLSGEYEQE